MPNQTSPAITAVFEFTDPHKEYVDYTNRDEAVDMENELSEQQSRVQTEDYTEEQLQKLKGMVPEQSLPFKQYIEYMNRSAATKQHESEDFKVMTKNDSWKIYYIDGIL